MDKKGWIDGKIEIAEFISNNFEWAASSICDLYKARWGIEVFFKQLKQTLQLADFLGNSENAVRWQIWTALLAY
ncbi:MAG: transposase, partial [Chitinivibrionales bacterium]|nr:transposase [Chitinivibrionales bacterium]